MDQIDQVDDELEQSSLLLQHIPMFAERVLLIRSNFWN